MSRPILALLALLVGLASADVASAQSVPGDGRMELSAVFGWGGGFNMNSQPAEEFDRLGGPVQLFATAARLEPALTLGGRVGVALNDRFAVEGGLLYSTPDLTVQITDDVENGPDTEATERVDQIAFEGALLIHLRPAAISRTRVFVLAGAGFLRELHEGQTLAENGQSYFAGLGVAHALVERAGSLKALGIRFDGRMVFRMNGVALDESMHAAPSVSGSLFLRF